MQQLLNAALLVASVAHDGQYDKAGKPYLLHVLRVYQNLNSTDEELNCIAVLHDVIEDTNTTYDHLREIGMPERVIAGVKLLTKVPEEGQTAEEYLEGILSSEDAMLVKKADLQDNMDVRRLKGVTEKDIARMNKYVIMYHTIEEKLKALHEQPVPVSKVAKIDFGGFTMEIPVEDNWEPVITTKPEAIPTLVPEDAFSSLSPELRWTTENLPPLVLEEDFDKVMDDVDAPVVDEPKTYPKTIKDLVNKRFSKPVPETKPVKRAPKEGDTVRLLNLPRDSWGFTQPVADSLLTRTFKLGAPNKLHYQGQWQGFNVIDGAPLAWVRSDDVEVVE